jgi:hypothetical protein
MRQGSPCLLALSLAGTLAACSQAVRPYEEPEFPVDGFLDVSIDASDDAPVDAPVDVPLLPGRRTSYLEILQQSEEIAARSGDLGGSVTGWFFSEAPAEARNSFLMRQEGACRVQRWTDYAAVRAGTITLTGRGAPTVVNPASVDPPLYYLEVERGRWRPGEFISVTSSGAAVPPLSAGVIFPPAVTIDAPSLPAPGESFRLATDRELRVRWHGAAPPFVEVYLWGAFVRASPASWVSVRCRFSGAAGQGVVPASVLSALRGAANSGLRIDAVHLQSVQAGGYPVELIAAHRVFWTPTEIE